MAEPEGFEPSIPGKRYAALAKRCLQPLGHSSNRLDMPDADARRKRQIATGAIPAELFADRCDDYQRHCEAQLWKPVAKANSADESWR